MFIPRKTHINLNTFRIKPSLVFFLAALFFLTSCPVKQTVFAFFGGGQMQKHQTYKRANLIKASKENFAFAQCKTSLNEGVENIFSNLKNPQIKTTFGFLSVFSFIFLLGIRFLGRNNTFFYSFQKHPLSSPLYIKNCLFLI